MESTLEVDQIVVSEDENGFRLDKLLVSRFEGYSRTYFQTLIEEGFVLLNGEKTKKAVVLSPNDEIEIFFRLTPEIDLTPEFIPFSILYEDEHILAINKPTGLVVHPGAGNWNHTFVNGLLYHCQNSLDLDGTLRPGIVHRLDKDTSGVLIAAKTTKAHQELISSFAKREVDKVYLAICIGHPLSQTISSPIGRHPKNRKQMAVIADGKTATTHLHFLGKNGKLGFVLLRPITGRTHQLRVHLHSIGCPILGDMTYGNASLNKHYTQDKQLLHAYSLKINHPITKVPLKLMAPLPQTFKEILHTFRDPTIPALQEETLSSI